MERRAPRGLINEIRRYSVAPFERDVHPAGGGAGGGGEQDDLAGRKVNVSADDDVVLLSAVTVRAYSKSSNFPL